MQMATESDQRESALAATHAAAQPPTAAESDQGVLEAGLTNMPEEQMQAEGAPEPGEAGDDFMSDMMADLLA